MFGLFSKAECPVDLPTKKWIEDTLLWYKNKFGEKYFKGIRFIPPNPEFFKTSPDHGEGMTEDFARQLSNYFEIDPFTYKLCYYSDDTAELPEGVGLSRSSGTSYPIQQFFNSKKNITEIYINRSEFEDPERLISGLLYVLALLKFKESGGTKKMHGYLIDLYCVIIGGGLIRANSVFRYEKLRGTFTFGWKTSGRGFLSQQMFAYTLALIAVLREEESPEWANYLCMDVKAYFNRSIKYIKETKDPIEFIKNNSKLDFQKDPPDFLTTELTHYENGNIFNESEMKNGIKDGHTKYYHSNGKFWAEWVYREGKPWTVISNFNSKGEPQEKGTLLEGNGTFYSYHDNDLLQFIRHYQDGKLMREEIFNQKSQEF